MPDRPMSNPRRIAPLRPSSVAQPCSRAGRRLAPAPPPVPITHATMRLAMLLQPWGQRHASPLTQVVGATAALRHGPPTHAPPSSGGASHPARCPALTSATAWGRSARTRRHPPCARPRHRQSRRLRGAMHPTQGQGAAVRRVAAKGASPARTQGPPRTRPPPPRGLVPPPQEAQQLALTCVPTGVAAAAAAAASTSASAAPPAALLHQVVLQQAGPEQQRLGLPHIRLPHLQAPRRGSHTTRAFSVRTHSPGPDWHEGSPCTAGPTPP